MHKGLNFRYVQFATTGGTGYCCISFEWEKTGEVIKYSAGVSFCSPKDTFDKERARRSAQVRREGQRENSKGMKISSFVLASNKNRFVTNDEFDAVLRDIFVRAEEKGLVPNWAAKALRNNTFKFGMREEQNIGKNRLPPVLAIPGKLVKSQSTERI